MMWSLVFASWLVAAHASGATSLTGTVRVAHGAAKPTLYLMVEDEGSVRLDGDLLAELQRLGGAKVELVGERLGEKFAARAYRILDVGKGVRPLVGILAQHGESGLALSDGTGPPIPLSLKPRFKSRLADKVGAKLWVYGKELLSGELKVRRYGILKDPSSAPSGEERDRQGDPRGS